MDIIKPNFPAGGDPPYFKYLASVGITEDVLAGCCIKKGRVTGIYDRQNINVEVDGIEYTNVPVWIHTDVGARAGLVNETDSDNPADYFKDAGLMFAFEGDDEDSYTYVSVMMFGTSAQGVLGVLRGFCNTPGAVIAQPSDVGQYVKDIVAETDAPLPTYRPYGKVDIQSVWDNGTDILTETNVGLIDLLDGGVAMIPTYSGSIPGAPLYLANIDNYTEADVSAFLSTGIHLLSLGSFEDWSEYIPYADQEPTIPSPQPEGTTEYVNDYGIATQSKTLEYIGGALPWEVVYDNTWDYPLYYELPLCQNDETHLDKYARDITFKDRDSTELMHSKKYMSWYSNQGSTYTTTDPLGYGLDRVTSEEHESANWGVFIETNGSNLVSLFGDIIEVTAENDILQTFNISEQHIEFCKNFIWDAYEYSIIFTEFLADFNVGTTVIDANLAGTMAKASAHGSTSHRTHALGIGSFADGINELLPEAVAYVEPGEPPWITNRVRIGQVELYLLPYDPRIAAL